VAPHNIKISVQFSLINNYWHFPLFVLFSTDR